MAEEKVATVEEQTPPVQESVPKLSDKEVLDNYLNDEQIKTNHRKIAEFLEQRFRGNWFTLDQIVKKTNVKSFPDAQQMMLGLHLFGLSTSKEDKGIVKFKITLSSKERIKVLEEHKQNHLKQIELLEAEIAKLQSMDTVQE